MPELILTFKFDGTVKKETKDFTGSDCIRKTKFIDEALGKVTKRTLKSEYYDSEQTETNTERHKA
jgi:hypothetical protein